MHMNENSTFIAKAIHHYKQTILLSEIPPTLNADFADFLESRAVPAFMTRRESQRINKMAAN